MKRCAACPLALVIAVLCVGLFVSCHDEGPDVKPGKCPEVKQRCNDINPPNYCGNDFGCPDKEKCCDLFCSSNCTLPVKPGTCPEVKQRCNDINPPNYCGNDFGCPGDEKCCDLFCSSNCTLPV